MKMRVKIAAWLLTFALIFSTVFVPASAAKVTVKKVTVASSLSGSKKTVVVAKGKSVKLSAMVTVTPNKTANKKVLYSVKNKKIATVSSKGVVKGKKTGTTKVTVTSKKNKKKKATITVKVVKGAVTSVKLNKSKASLNPGESLKLKATVKAGKGSCKTLNWTTSKKKVATVSSKGVVKAVGTGTTTITAKAIDGSGKKATCTVHVAGASNMGDMNLTNLVSMDIPNSGTLAFSLDKPCALNPSQVCVAQKKYAFGKYNKQIGISSMSTMDNVNYTVAFADDTLINEGDYVQVSIPSLTGTTKSLEMQYKKQAYALVGEVISQWTVGKYDSDEFTFNATGGYTAYSLSGVPAGLRYEVEDNAMVVKGIPTAPGTYDYVLSAVDEWGNTLTRTIHFIIGSDSVIAAAAVTTYSLAAEGGVSDWQDIRVTGGSGTYTCTILSDPLGTSVINQSNSTPMISMTAKVPGVYTIVVRITDAKDASLTTDINVVWNVKQGIMISGTLKDAQGNPMTRGSISFVPQNRGSQYITRNIWPYIEPADGSYCVVLEEGTYNVFASNDNNISAECAQSQTELYSQTFITSLTGYDIQLNDLYTVDLACEGTKIDFYTRWYVNQEYVGSGSTLYLKPGTYTLESSQVGSQTLSEEGNWWNGLTKFYIPISLVGAVTVANSRVATSVSRKYADSQETEIWPAAKDTTDSVKLNESVRLFGKDPCAFKFIPSESGIYKISDTAVYFYNMDGTTVESEDGVYNLIANTKYIVGTGEYTYKSFQITKVDSATSN